MALRKNQQVSLNLLQLKGVQAGEALGLFQQHIRVCASPGPHGQQVGIDGFLLPLAQALKALGGGAQGLNVTVHTSHIGPLAQQVNDQGIQLVLREAPKALGGLNQN
jgi:hypothetical protein